ncbi:MAG: hypothetical protein US57_C0011G0015 [Candidatus Moranbacteria bacterium GW2011_GWC2_37_73]|nr:MAG: hypothetical protein UR95_C0006G0163 [Parcubacteria group bacterium GW2011_GWC1_36_108]KKQ00360.1 MAG: hypothetical protein US09_C0013G0004 [Candidatus Moranbacteria bacterium GW2011_GWD1_36_198]KKQ01119.1 MAG: hypothetical protein US10_C0022G0015 [Candidatus Moranbacteria bacterium GW2011_GWD2_36_198]KKQ39527.1 MAG: hypothetical protein US57_C0011G0015 [Candidatus Moranbacteria bacterium GW2011_GWC2_37_73]HAR99737.1 hypothetical protein [Candidatus Moranbacteria bacterium]
METKETFIKCCKLDGKHKKVFVILISVIFLAIAVLSIAAAGWKMHERRGDVNLGIKYDGSGMMNRGGVVYPSPRIENQFIIPEDAAKSGELAIMVSDLEAAKKVVSAVATKNGGVVYSTAISYSGSKLKNGSIVVQIPVEKFDATFANLKTVGSKIIKESTQQIAPRNAYIMPMAAQEKVVADQDSVSSDSATSSIEPMIYPAPQQVSQNKGYIRVIFADYGKSNIAGNIANDNNFLQGSRGLWVALGAKILLLLVLFVLLIVMLKRIFRNLRAARVAKKAKTTTHHVHIVRQMPKTRQRVVRIAKKK